MTVPTALSAPVRPAGTLASPARPGSEGARRRPVAEQVLLYGFVVGPFLALLVGIGLAVAGHGISLLDAVLAVVFYAVSGLGVTVGYHRLLTHGSFKARRPLRVALAIGGSMSVEGDVVQWVADHRRHHQFSDKDGDPHSPWRFGTSPRAVLKGLWWAHTGWLFDREQSSKARYAPDLLADKDIAVVHRLFPLWVTVSLLAPPLIAFAVTGGSWLAAGSALLWASAVRILLLHHVTWSINSICHAVGEQRFQTRDRSTNVWPLSVLSFGESWHNWHHADPTSARHGVDKFQFDSSARLIALFEWLGWVSDVRWPRKERLAAKRA